MEDWEKKIITKNLDKLIKNTVCNETFLAILTASGILSDNDVTDLEEHSSNPTRKNSQFYSLIVKRVKGYAMLMKALNDTNQSGAYSILSEPLPMKINYLFRYHENEPLGKGKFATVMKGEYGHREVAVKRLFCADENETQRICTEIEILKRCGDDHENIVQYFADGRSAHFVLIIIELCDMTLKTWVDVDGEKPILITQWDILNQITSGLNWLHENRVLYQGLIPENILLKTNTKKIKISGFGESSLMKEGEVACAVSTDKVTETMGWDAPEVTQAQNATEDTAKLVSLASDVYSLGCMFYYVLTDGRHDFGDLKNLEVMENTPENSAVKEILLIKQMISDSPELRPSCSDLLSNPILQKQNVEESEQVDTISKEPKMLAEIKKIKERNKEITRENVQRPALKLLAKLNSFCKEISKTVSCSLKQLNGVTTSVLFIYLLYVTALLYRIAAPHELELLLNSYFLDQKHEHPTLETDELAKFDTETPQVTMENDMEQPKIVEFLKEFGNLDLEGKHSRLLEMVLHEDLSSIKAVLEDAVILEILRLNESSLLQIAVKRGDYDIFAYVINAPGFQSVFENHLFEHLIAELIEDIHIIEAAPFEQKCMILNLLFTKQPRLIEFRYEYQNTLLHLAMLLEFKNGRQVEFINMLLKHADVNAKNAHGDTPLHLAVNAQENLMKITRLLIAHNAEPDAVNDQGWTFLHKASECAPPGLFHEVTEYLVSIQRTESFTIVNSDGNNVLHYAVLAWETKPETLKIFKTYGADYNAIDNHGNSVIFLAIRFGRSEPFLKSLIRFGADWRIANEKRETVLHQAAYYNNLPALKLFISLHADVNARSVDGNTPLHKAVYSSYNSLFYHQIVLELVKNGADPNLKNIQGKLPIDIVKGRAIFGGIESDTLDLLQIHFSSA